MLGLSVVALVSASRRVAEAKGAIEERKSLRNRLRRRGQTEAARAVDLQIKDLQLDLAALERRLIATTTEVQRAFDAKMANESPRLMCRM